MAKMGKMADFKFEMIDNAFYVKLLTVPVERASGHRFNDFGNLGKKQEFINSFLDEVGFTFTGFVESFTRDKDTLFIFYATHLTKEPHDCQDLGCDGWCIKITSDEYQLFIYHKMERKVDFTKENYTRVHDHFVRIFSVLANVFIHDRAIGSLQTYFVNTPEWCTNFRTAVDASETSEAREAVVKLYQTTLRMTAIPRILLIHPEGDNPYAKYVAETIICVNEYTMLKRCRTGVQNAFSTTTSSTVAAAASLSSSSSAAAAASLSLDESDQASVGDESATDIFSIMARQDPEMKQALDTDRPKAMKAILEMFFETCIPLHIGRVCQLTVLELTEESFRALFDLYINISLARTPIESISDMDLICLSYLADCVGNRKMVFQIIDHFLPFRFEYMHRLWTREMPKASQEEMPLIFKSFLSFPSELDEMERAEAIGD